MLGVMPSSGQSAPPPPSFNGDATAFLSFLRYFGEPCSLGSQDVLFHEGDPCRGAHFVEEGEVHLTVSAGPRILLLGRALTGHLMNIASVIARTPCQSTATVHLPAKLLFLEEGKIREYLRQDAASCLHIVQLLGSDLLDISDGTIRTLRQPPRFSK